MIVIVSVLCLMMSATMYAYVLVTSCLTAPESWGSIGNLFGAWTCSHSIAFLCPCEGVLSVLHVVSCCACNTTQTFLSKRVFSLRFFWDVLMGMCCMYFTLSFAMHLRELEATCSIVHFCDIFSRCFLEVRILYLMSSLAFGLSAACTVAIPSAKQVWSWAFWVHGSGVSSVAVIHTNGESWRMLSTGPGTCSV